MDKIRFLLHPPTHSLTHSLTHSPTHINFTNVNRAVDPVHHYEAGNMEVSTLVDCASSPVNMEVSSGSVTLQQDALNGYPVLVFQPEGGANAQMKAVETSRFSGLVS